MAAEAIRADKEWEAEQGFIRGWVAHIFHMKTAGRSVQDADRLGLEADAADGGPGQLPRTHRGARGARSRVEGTRRNARMVIEYVEGWLNGRGAKGIDSLEGKPGVHPALMEDLATGRMSVAQIAQRILHRARDTAGPASRTTSRSSSACSSEELDDILARRPGRRDARSAIARR